MRVFIFVLVMVTLSNMAKAQVNSDSMMNSEAESFMTSELSAQLDDARTKKECLSVLSDYEDNHTDLSEYDNDAGFDQCLDQAY